MIRRLTCAVAAIFLLVITPLAAHEDFRIIGVITKRYTDKNKQEMMEVQYDDKSTITLWISKLTKVVQNGKPLTTAALKEGVSIIADTYGDEADYSEVLQAQIVPAKK
jgi:hypothetical protein